MLNQALAEILADAPHVESGLVADVLRPVRRPVGDRPAHIADVADDIAVEVCAELAGRLSYQP
jgi:hypothetical protein